MRHHLQALHASVSRWRLSSSLDVRHDHGASAVEYALIAALIAVVILMSVVLYYALTSNRGVMLFSAVIAGLLQDSLSLIPAGYSAFCFGVVGVVLNRLVNFGGRRAGIGIGGGDAGVYGRAGHGFIAEQNQFSHGDSVSGHCVGDRFLLWK